MTISTTAPSARLLSFGWSGVALLCAGIVVLKMPRRRFSPFAVSCVAIFAIAMGSTGCGGGSGGSGGTRQNPGTPQGSYTISVIATTSDGVVSHGTSFILQLQ
ncbi:MAG: hypothetical protein JO356_15685 [Acidobacteria bacterium]|nr:hypothetical protein [Acidobacteriota bacterium]